MMDLGELLCWGAHPHAGKMVAFIAVQSLSHIWLCDSVICSTSGLPIPHHLLEFAQVHIHWISDAIQPSHPLPPPSAFNLSQHQGALQAFHIRWPKYWSFNFSIDPSNQYSGLISLGIDLFDLLAIQRLSRVFSSTTVRKRRFFLTQSPLWSNSDTCTWLLEKS